MYLFKLCCHEPTFIKIFFTFRSKEPISKPEFKQNYQLTLTYLNPR